MISMTWIVPIMVFFTSIIGWQYFVGLRTVKPGQCYVQYMDDAIFNCLLQVSTVAFPFPQIDIIGAMVIVWRVRGKIISSVLCNIVHHNCAECNAHTHEQTKQFSGLGFVSLGPFHCV